ncbi:hypothetical protein KCU79_g10785, partial [Aureobasidium melanogenum]
MDIPHAASSPDISYISTASAPSLRARDSTASMASPRPSYLAGEEGGNVKVVVRVRKFLPRELERQAPCLIEMDPETQKTTIHPPLASTLDANSRKVYEEKSFV